jgi:antitoxin component of RelBE/YafQ-DinJ toxin-antitoxin module
LQYTLQPVTPKTASTFRIDDELLDALQKVKDRDGIPLSEQVRRALKMWLESKGVRPKLLDRKK